MDDKLQDLAKIHHVLQVKISTPVILLFCNSTEIRMITKTCVKKIETSLLEILAYSQFF